MYAEGASGTTNFALYGTAAGGTTAYGIYAIASGATTNYAGYFSGNVVVTGTILNSSDGKLKEGISSLSTNGVLLKVLALNPVSYQFKEEEFADMHLPSGTHYGLIADEVESVFPELVSLQTHASVARTTGEEGEDVPDVVTMKYKGVNYIEMIPLLIQSIKEQQERIAALEALLQIQGSNE